jgi:hypothetical protein
MKLWKSSDFDHEKINLVEKNVGTPAMILGRSLIKSTVNTKLQIIVLQK